jgi:hypothetical protein
MPDKYNDHAYFPQSYNLTTPEQDVVDWILSISASMVYNSKYIATFAFELFETMVKRSITKQFARFYIVTHCGYSCR